MRACGVSKRAKIAGSIVVAIAAGDCTAFNDLEVDPTYLDSIDQAAQVCTKLASCADQRLAEAVERSIGVPVSDDNFSVCMTWLTAPLPTDRIGVDAQRSLLQCLVGGAATLGCDAMASCMYVRPIVDTADAGCTTDIDHCEGEDTAVDCHQSLVFNCNSARYGDRTVCVVGAQGHVGCALGGCFPSGITASCNGGITDTCDETSRLRLDQVCSTEGLGCDVVPADGSVLATATCGFDEACSDTAGTARCSSEGAEVEACDGSTKSIFNCSGVDLVCIDDSATIGTHAVCGVASDPCSPFSATINTCSNDTLNACVGGQPTAIDCTKYGAHCVEAANQLSTCHE